MKLRSVRSSAALLAALLAGLCFLDSTEAAICAATGETCSVVSAPPPPPSGGCLPDGAEYSGDPATACCSQFAFGRFCTCIPAGQAAWAVAAECCSRALVPGNLTCASAPFTSPVLDNTDGGTRASGTSTYFITGGIMAGYTFNSSSDATLLNLTIAAKNQINPGTYGVRVLLTTVDGSGDPDLGSVTASAKFSITVPDSPAEYRTLVLPGNFTMAAGVTYGLLLADGSDGPNQGFQWTSTNGDPQPTVGAPFTLTNQKFTNTNGTSWLTNIFPPSIRLYAAASIT